MMRIRFLPAILAMALAGACDSSSGTTPVTVLGYTVTIKTAAPTSAQIGSPLRITYTVTENESDSTSKPASGKTLTVAVTVGGGTVNGAASTTLTTATDGSVSLTWVLGSLAGTQTIRGSSSYDHFLDVSVIATAGPAARLTLKMQPSSVLTGVALTPQPTVQLEDAGGNPVALGAVPITAAIATGGGTLGGALTVNSDATGLATFTDLSLSGVAGIVTLKFVATVNGQTATDTSSAINVIIPWTTRASMPTPRWGLAVGAVNGILYAVGGYNNANVLGTVEAYDPATNTWTTKASMPTPRHGLAVGVVNGILYAVGGDTTSAETGFDLDVATVEAYDPATNSWTTKASMPTPRGNLAIGVVNGILYAVGGNGSGMVEAYDPATDSWTTRAAMPTRRNSVAIGVVNGILYAVGGDSVGVVEAYDPAGNSWTTKALMPTPRAAPSVGVVNGILYVVGGFNGGVLGTFAAYDPVSNSWTTRGETMTPRNDLSVSVVNGVLYAVGGLTAASSILGTVESFAP